MENIQQNIIVFNPLKNMESIQGIKKQYIEYEIEIFDNAQEMNIGEKCTEHTKLVIINLDTLSYWNCRTYISTECLTANKRGYKRKEITPLILLTTSRCEDEILALFPRLSTNYKIIK